MFGLWNRIGAISSSGIKGANRYIISLLNIPDARNSPSTTIGYPSDAVIADGPSLITVPAGTVVMPGQRLVGSTWHTTDANGVPLGNPVVVDVADAATNKCTCIKANPTDTTGWTKSGDAAAVFSVVDDAANISASVLRNVCSSGKVYKLDNSAGVADAFVYPGGANGNLNKHSISIYARGGSGALSLGSATGLLNFNSSGEYVSISSGNITPASTNQYLVVHADAGQVVYFILPGLYESAFVPSSAPVIGADTAATATCLASQPSAPVSNLLTPTLGAQLLEWTPDQAGQVDKTIAACWIDATHWLKITCNATQIIVSYQDGANTDSAAFAYAHVADVASLVAIYWDAAANQLGVRAAAKTGNIDGETWATCTFSGMTSLPSLQHLGHTNGTDVLSGTVGQIDMQFSNYLVEWG